MRTGVLVIGHGTDDQRGAEECFRLTDQLRKRLAPQPVESCFLERRPPTIQVGWKRLQQQQVTHVQALPLLLLAAGHAKRDIPLSLAKCVAEEPAMTFEIGRPLSRQGALVDLAVRRAVDGIAVFKDQPESSVALVLVGRGSTDPCAQTDLRIFAELVRHRIPVQEVTTAFYAMAHPRLPDVLDRIAANQKIRSIVVQPHLLFEGKINQSIAKLVDDAATRNPTVRFIKVPHLGPDPLVVESLMAKLHA